MKIIINSLWIILLFGLMTISCEKKGENDNEQLIITGQLISNSACKNGLKSGHQPIETPDSLSCVEYSFEEESNKLTLKHINAGFNCCPDSLYCDVRLNGDTILIQEFEKKAECRCNCLYDMVIEINGVDITNYQVKFIEPYIAEQDKLVFEIDLTKDQAGSFCVTRKKYPWGVESLNE